MWPNLFITLDLWCQNRLLDPLTVQLHLATILRCESAAKFAIAQWIHLHIPTCCPLVRIPIYAFSMCNLIVVFKGWKWTKRGRNWPILNNPPPKKITKTSFRRFYKSEDIEFHPKSEIEIKNLFIHFRLVSFRFILLCFLLQKPDLRLTAKASDKSPILMLSISVTRWLDYDLFFSHLQQ